MSLWIAFSLAAAAFQTVRFMLQKRLADTRLTAVGATFARFLYSAPIAVLVVWLAGGLGPDGPGGMGRVFWLYATLGGAAQVLATVCVVTLFKARNFAVGVTFAKTEVILTVLVGLVLLGESVSIMGLTFITLGVLGVVLLSVAPEVAQISLASLINRAAGLGVASGLLFSISAVSYRAASLEIATDDPLMRAGLTLAAVTSLQLVGMALWLAVWDRVEIGRVAAAWRSAGFIGLTSLAGSFCWFTAFTLQNAALVKAVGQVELIFVLLASTLVFRETVGRRELLGVALLGASILGIVAAL